MPHPLVYDPVEASRARWIEQGWRDRAAGMAAVVSVMRAEQIFLNRANDILRPLGLTFARYQVLGMVRWAGPLTLGAVGRRLWITPGTVTNSIDRLEAAGLCRRVSHPTDARATLVEITAKGRRLFDRGREAERRSVRDGRSRRGGAQPARRAPRKDPRCRGRRRRGRPTQHGLRRAGLIRSRLSGLTTLTDRYNSRERRRPDGHAVPVGARAVIVGCGHTRHGAGGRHRVEV